MNTFNRAYFLRLYKSEEDKSSHGKLNSYLQIVREWINTSPKRKKNLLDIGCGYGKFLQKAETHFHTYGTDVSPYVINQAKKIARKTVFKVTRLESYNSTKKFDVITAFDVLEHTEHINKSVKKIFSLLKSGGIFVAVVPVYDGILGKIGGLLDKDLTHIQKLSRWQWLELFQRYFTIVEKQGVIRYSLPWGISFHLLFPWLFQSGQAILVVMKKQ